MKLPIEEAQNRPSVLRWARRMVIIVIGFSVLLFGVCLICTPIPGVLVIPVGLGLLAGEFVWARKALQWVQAKIEALKGKAPPD